MHAIRILILSLAVVLGAAVPAQAGDPILASGAGYKAYATDLARAFSQSGSGRIDMVFGNMARVMAQARAGGSADFVFGAEWFFEQGGLDTSRCLAVGRGGLALVQSAKMGAAPVDPADARVRRVVMPDPGRAIYGRAADQYLESANLKDRLGQRLVVVATVPQAGAYVMSGEADMGFVNRAHAARIADKVGAVRLLDQGYEPINIVLCRTGTPDTPEVKSFLRFMETKAARDVAREHGF